MKRLLMFLLSAFLLASVVSAQPFLTCAADYHLALKGDYLNGTTNVTDFGVWPYVIPELDPPTTTYNNVEGVTADGMLYATKALSDSSYGLATFSTANLLVGRYDATPTTRPYSTDVEFLTNVCEFDSNEYLGGNSAYCVKATEFYGRVTGQFPNPTALVNRYIIEAGRGSLAGWDIASHIRAAWRSGWHTYAVGLVEEIMDRRVEWEHVPLGGYDYTTISHGSLVRVMVEMYHVGDLDVSRYSDALLMAAALLPLQEVDGSWENDPQVTAFVLLGLRSETTDMQIWHTAIVLGENYLENSAVNCAWVYDTGSGTEGYGEVNSEAIMALSLINSLPFIDGFETSDTSAWTDEVGAPFAPPAFAPIRSARMPRIYPLR
ncbi:MAG: hypothetical protein KBD65_01990 [Candidatus Moranbacteria bacterium]|nr:hypothetical protein [Candidatus Moranbacteria bacterium]